MCSIYKMYAPMDTYDPLFYSYTENTLGNININKNMNESLYFL